MPRLMDIKRKNIFYSDKKKRHTVKNQIKITIMILSFIKQNIKKEKGMTIFSIYRGSPCHSKRDCKCL
jgi:hypothetical protein